MPIKLAALAAALLVSGFTCTKNKQVSQHDKQTTRDLGKGFAMDKATFEQQLAMFTEQEHPMGSERQAVLSHYLVEELAKHDVTAERHEFEVDTPNPAAMDSAGAPVALTLKKNAINVSALLDLSKADDCVIIWGSHYDTKILSEGEYLGANDSASSSILLLQMVRYLKQDVEIDVNLLACDILLLWIDGEESVLPNWRDGELKHPAKMVDHTYGSQYFVSQLTQCGEHKCLPKDLGGHEVRATIIVDMIGSPDLRFTRDRMSTRSLLETFLGIVEELGYGRHIETYEQSVEDDHVPFLRAGIDALDIIDFSNLQHWHKPTDIASTVSMESIEIAGKVSLSLVLQLAL